MSATIINRRNAIACLFLLSLHVNVQSQPGCDCEQAVKLRPAIASYFNSGKLDSAEIIISGIDKFPSEVCKTFYYDGMAQIAISNKKFEQGRVWLEKESLLLEKLKCKNLLTRFYNTFSRYFQETSQPDSVLTVSFKALKLAEEDNNLYAQARALANLATIFEQQSQYDKSMEYNRKAVAAARSLGDTTILAATLVRLADSYYDLYIENKTGLLLDSMFFAAKEAVDITNSPAGLMDKLDGYSQFSKYYLAKKKFEYVQSYADSILLLSPLNRHDFNRHRMNAYLRKSDAYLQQSNYKEAIRMGDSSYRYAGLFNLQLAGGSLENIYKAARFSNDNSKALWAYERLTAIKDSMFTVGKNTAINELEKKYNQAKNEQTIIELKQAKEIFTLRNKILAAGLAAAFLAVAVVIFYVRQLSLKNSQKILEVEQRLNRMRMNPHFFFNTLSALQSYVLRENDGKSAAANLSRFSQLMRQTLESSYKEYVTIEEEEEFLQQYFDLQKIRFPGKFEYEIKIDDSVDVSNTLIPGMIIQPFAENSLEHGLGAKERKGYIRIRFAKSGEEIRINIEDDGEGIQVQKSKSHVPRAMQIIKDRLYLLNKKEKANARYVVRKNSTELPGAGETTGVDVEIFLPLILKHEVALN